MNFFGFLFGIISAHQRFFYDITTVEQSFKILCLLLRKNLWAFVSQQPLLLFKISTAISKKISMDSVC